MSESGLQQLHHGTLILLILLIIKILILSTPSKDEEAREDHNLLVQQLTYLIIVAVQLKRKVKYKVLISLLRSATTKANIPGLYELTKTANCFKLHRKSATI